MARVTAPQAEQVYATFQLVAIADCFTFDATQDQQFEHLQTKY